MLDAELEDQIVIRQMVEHWALWRDAQRWDLFPSLWHDDGMMTATWYQGSYRDFMRVSQEGFRNGVRILHMLGGSFIDVKGPRATAETKMTIAQRAPVESVICDVICNARSYDFLEKRDGRWGIVRRETIYDRDRIDPVDPAQTLRLDPELLARFPEGYRHLAYLQTRVGYQVKPDLPGLTGPAADDLYARGAAWLRGDKR
jgi:hypothetical protein